MIWYHIITFSVILCICNGMYIHIYMYIYIMCKQCYVILSVLVYCCGLRYLMILRIFELKWYYIVLHVITKMYTLFRFLVPSTISHYTILHVITPRYTLTLLRCLVSSTISHYTTLHRTQRAPHVTSAKSQTIGQCRSTVARPAAH